MRDVVADLSNDLKKYLAGEVYTDVTTRILYSTDASLYQIEPLGVVFPKTLDDLNVVMELCASYQIPVLARGAGSSLAGQAIGAAFILDLSRYLNHIIKIDRESLTAWVEPGVVLVNLNRAAADYGLQFGPDPASAERATIGGSLANNATGAHSIVYGMAADHLRSVEVVLSDGSTTIFESIPLEIAYMKAGVPYEFSKSNSNPELHSSSRIEVDIYRAVLQIRQEYADIIRQKWPHTWRRASGYNLNYLIPWSASQPFLWGVGHSSSAVGEAGMPYPPIRPGHLNLAALLAGSEGTLAIIRRATIGLVPLPRTTHLVVLAFPDVGLACDATPEILEYKPTAVELIPGMLIQLARSIPAYARQLRILDHIGAQGEHPPTILAVEFSNETSTVVQEKVRHLNHIAPAFLAESPEIERQVWAVRKVGLGILMSRAGDIRPCPFIEDISVPVEALGKFVRGMERVLAEFGTYGELYGHASVGCLHFRPLLNLKTVDGVRNLRSIAQQVAQLAIAMGGVLSGEHGDGLARSEWNELLFGKQIIQAFRLLKSAADPRGLLNPGKIISLSDDEPLPRMDHNLRISPAYSAIAWKPTIDFSRQSSLEAAIELCNGAGVCRKEEGVMCPSFQATKDEMYSTRGRANLLRAMISGRFPSRTMAEKAVYEAIDLCLACKGCKAECPSAVDMAKLKYEFLHYYYSSLTYGHRRPLRDFLFAYIVNLSRLVHPFALVLNPFLENPFLARLFERFLGLSHLRKLPNLSQRSLRQQLRDRERRGIGLILDDVSGFNQQHLEVFFLSDAFTEFFYPEIGLAACDVLKTAGCQVTILPVIGAGRTFISKGFLDQARNHARRLLSAIQELDPDGIKPIIGIEPSEIYTLCDEYQDLIPGNEWVQQLAERSFTVEEWLVRLREVKNTPCEGKNPLEGDKNYPQSMRIAIISNQFKPQNDQKINEKVLYHGHCYQKARPPASDGLPVGVEASIELLKSVGYFVQETNSGCCGMAGAFGYEADHYDISMKVGELALFPTIRETDAKVIIAASGVSCRAQIKDGTNRTAYHPIELVARKLNIKELK